MDNVRLGRRLGIGTRLAAKVLREQAQKAGSSASASSPAPAAKRRVQAAPNPASAPPPSAAARKAIPSGNFVRGAARGSLGFGRAFWKPFSAAGRALWHEVTGLFFALFALFFAQGVWRFRGSWRSGPQHGYFVGCLVIAALFLYFSVSAFVRSRRTPH